MNPDRARDARWYAKLPRVRLSDKKQFTTIHCLILQRNESGAAPIVLDCDGMFFKTPSAMYDASFELCLRHLHMQTVPLHEACNVQQLLENRATHALKLPGRYVPTTDGSVSTLTPPETDAEAEAEEPQDNGPTRSRRHAQRNGHTRDKGHARGIGHTPNT